MDMKGSFLPKTRIEKDRRQRYEDAVKHLRENGHPEITLSAWIRQACDELARRGKLELGVHK